MSFRVVLAACDALNDDALPDKVKIKTALDLLVKDRHKGCDVDLFRAVISVIFPEKKKDKSPPVIDFSQDWEYIYAAFRQAYGIDLFAESEMHWFLFLALIRGLPKSTRMAEIMEIRDTPLPARTKYNAKEIDRLKKAKAAYALKSKEPEDFSASFNALFDSLTARAKAR